MEKATEAAKPGPWRGSRSLSRTGTCQGGEGWTATACELPSAQLGTLRKELGSAHFTDAEIKAHWATGTGKRRVRLEPTLCPPRALEEAHDRDPGLPPPAGPWVPLYPGCFLRHCDRSSAEPMYHGPHGDSKLPSRTPVSNP